MTERLKREIKEKPYRRHGKRSFVAEAPSSVHATALSAAHIATKRRPEASTICLQPGTDSTPASKNALGSIAFGQPDTILLMFYLEHLFPFLFPFYRPPPLHGGRTWIFEMMLSSPVVRQATLCQSSYFFSLARGTANRDEVWAKVLEQTSDAFKVLKQSLKAINTSGIAEHLHSAVQIMTGIIQIQHFEIASLNYSNCQAHLNASLALFKQLLDSSGIIEPAIASSKFNALISLLGPSSWNLPNQCIHIPSSEQAAFRFSSAILILDDIIASTVLQEPPKLHEYHRSLLKSLDGSGPPINFEAVVGCQNWALLQLGEIAVLDAWKQRYKRAGNLSVMELVNRAARIKDSLEADLMQLETNSVTTSKEDNSPLDILTADDCQQSKTLARQSYLVTHVWAHAALVYLHVVVSGWQPASVDVKHHVSRVVELIGQISPPALLRTMVWPFCVAGFLADPVQETHLRAMVEELQPSSVFGTLHKALEIMENVWCNRDVADAASCDLAMCFRSQGDLVLLF
jgi:hypothetical protein